jgi:hypothetical protein
MGVIETGHHNIEKRYNYIFNSARGDLLVPGNKARFSVNFTSTINFPDDASSIQVGLHSANIRNTVPNITTGQFDTLSFIQDGLERTIVVPQGSYSACALQITINELLEQEYLGTGTIPTLTFLGNSATQVLSIEFVEAGGAIDWSQSSIGFVLGFDTTDVQPGPSPPGSTAGQVITGDTLARFDWPITNFLILCPELVADGLPLNQVGLGVAGAVPILAAPGSLIAYEAKQILFVQCDHLIGQRISQLTFDLTNERGEIVQMDQDWNCILVMKIEY